MAKARLFVRECVCLGPGAGVLVEVMVAFLPRRRKMSRKRFNSPQIFANPKA